MVLKRKGKGSQEQASYKNKNSLLLGNRDMTRGNSIKLYQGRFRYILGMERAVQPWHRLPGTVQGSEVPIPGGI